MARHRARKKRLRWIMVTALAVAGIAIAATAVALLRDPGPPPQTEPAEPAEPAVVNVCTTLRTVTATSFEPVLSELAPVLSQGSDCVRLDVDVADGQAAEVRVAEAAADVWISDQPAPARVDPSDESDAEGGGAGADRPTGPN